MQPLENVEHSTTAQIFAAHLALIATDIQAWADLLAEDAVVEFPYACALGSPERLEGKLTIYNYIKNAIAQMQNLTFTNIREYQTSNPDVLFAEVHGEARILATGRHYHQDYVMRLETKAGKIFHYREYWNPSSVLDTWSNSRQALNAQ
ncbi:MAG TPA: phenazine biosynthesis protein [Cyanobacteria bacterium UBA8553]|nr:phenazine biosynthesis protein [Cyanobacteria bacterium UBA8553]